MRKEGKDKEDVREMQNERKGGEEEGRKEGSKEEGKKALHEVIEAHCYGFKYVSEVILSILGSKNKRMQLYDVSTAKVFVRYIYNIYFATLQCAYKKTALFSIFMH